MKSKCIGIIAEDISDFETAKILVKRITKKSKLSFKKAIGHGCGKLRRKASDYAIDLYNRGCDVLILMHDLDRNDFSQLKKDLNSILKTSPIEKKFICIPIEEIEAWFLGDLKCIQKTFNLKRKPKIDGLPQNVKSPKEKLGELIYICSEKHMIYLNTKHNQMLAQNISVDLVKGKCDSFLALHDFLTTTIN